MSSWHKHREARTQKWVVWGCCKVHAQAGERSSSALTIGQLSAAEADAVCCTICSSCTRVADVRRRVCPFQDLQLEHEQLFGNGLRRDQELSSAEVSTEPDPDGRLVRRPETRRSADLRLFATNPQICTFVPTIIV